MNKNVLLFILVFLLGFLSLGAIFGGGALMIYPGGELLRMPTSNLGTAPFKNFFIPGLILFSALGLLPVIVIIGLIEKPGWKICESLNLIKDMHWSWTFCIYVAFATIIWIQVEMIFLQVVLWIHTFYMAYALLIIIVSLLPPLRKSFRKEADS
jgi:hypothetical protein